MSKNDIARDEREWARAFALRKDLAPYIHTGFQSNAVVKDFCRAHEISKSSAYRLLNRLRANDRAAALRRSKPGPKKMSIRFCDETEKVVYDYLRKVFLKRNKISVAKALKQINGELSDLGLPGISKTALTNRIETIPDRVLKLKRHGGTAARQAYQIIRGRYVVKDPLAVVQIDHTVLDIMVVDPDTCECIGRPYLTVLLDIATRMPTGIYLSMNAPSAINLMKAFHRSVFPKAEYLAELGIPYEWPVYGLPLVISSDNGTDLKSEAFNWGLEQYGVEHIFRPVAQPHLGGHVERFIGTIQTFVHTLPGTTFSNIEKKGTYQPEKQATLSLRDVERLLLEFILRDYVHDRKRRLLTSPMNAWNVRWRESKSRPHLPSDPERFRLDFLPFENRNIQREGLELFGMFYRSEHLQKMKNCGVQNITIKYDPTDIRIVQFSADNETYYEARGEHFPRNPLSVDEFQKLRKTREERLNASLSVPDAAEAHDFRKQILADARKRKKAATSSEMSSLPQGRDIRDLGGFRGFSERGKLS
ncbi:transposase [Aliiroseovarius sp. CAU 1755]|uniref:Mu transposase C-terminal domain-containing protein n=1 Tax=Aliiroseovarius sp. S1339 TaxID=2936990 RepID=UPI0020BE03FF|nr:Mu transposase C-terminal domain-containing protein [Aliiroseovarius sp. S1339]MCK8463526.1 DDE-type integrase/transposase/recombinase [Aliiroseovarius sp. S1339]